MTIILNSKPLDLRQKKFQFAKNVALYVSVSVKDCLKSVYGEEAKIVPIVNFFTTEQLSLALGLENVIHAAIACKRNGANLVSAVKKLEQYDEK